MISDNLIRETARRTIQIETQALENLQQAIDEDFVYCVKRIYESRGRVVVTGIGKSALVGQKIVATLNSTGTPALFMHAADAIHGDLGMIGPDDLVICLSKSGETPEIRMLVPLLKSLGNAFVAMVSNPDSYLGKQAHYRLLTPVSQEADPNNLAPTASTTAQMAMGDALATALLALRGFTPSDFAQYHPGGALGKQLYLTVEDLSSQNEKPSVGLEEPVPGVILEITSKRLGATAVLDADGHLCGIVTDGDLRRMLEKHHAINGLKAADIMTPSPKVITPDALAVKALEAMRRYSITQLVVTEHGKYLGMVHLHDLIREGLI